MRCLHPNSDYYEFLNNMDDNFSWHPALASMMLTEEYPTLRTEEAKAIYCDWRANRKRKS